ncbi:MAG: hypothetical protein ACYCSB_02285 [bacterium]|jgi:hypothetical protein
MGTCFVIQPFDNGGSFDKRFNETLKPAIVETGLKAYRVDEDPKVSIIIESIEENIDNSEVVLADISEDNPNVWFELGLAIKSKKDVILICSANRGDKFPVDVQHRKIIKYNTQSQSDFDKLKTEIKDRINLVLNKKTTLDKLPSQQLVADTKGLAQHEIIILVSIAQNLKHVDDYALYSSIKEDAERQGLSPVAISIGLNGLVKKDMSEHMKISGYSYDDPYDVYKLKPKGWAWLEENQSKLIMGVFDKSSSDEDIPF